MKNRKTVVVAFLLVAVMLMSVGYAALSDTLDINGTAEVLHGSMEPHFDNGIYFENAKANMDGDTATVNNQNNDKASFTINSLTAVGQEATVTFTIKNANTDLDAEVTPQLSDASKPAYFEIKSDWNRNPKLIRAGESATYTVTVKLIKTPQETISGSFWIELNAKSVEPTPSQG